MTTPADGTCQACGGPLPPVSDTGRPRKFCSNRCRSRARRERQRQTQLTTARKSRLCETELAGHACDRAAMYVLVVDGAELRVCQECRDPTLALLVGQGAAATAIEVRRVGVVTLEQAPAGPVQGRVLLIEDDDRVSQALVPVLRRRGFDMVWAATGSAGLREAIVRSLDVILLDLGLPDMDGIKLLRTLREASNVPVIVVSARGDVVDRVLGLDNGAHDYLVKPYDLDELVARMRNVMRQEAKSSVEVYDDGVLQVVHTLREVRIGREVVKLSEREFRLLALLIRSAGTPLTAVAIAAHVWSETEAPIDGKRSVTVLVAVLRSKLSARGLAPDAIVTAHGIGYYYQPPRPATAGPRIGYSHTDRLLNSAGRQVDYNGDTPA